MFKKSSSSIFNLLLIIFIFIVLPMLRKNKEQKKKSNYSNQNLNANTIQKVKEMGNMNNASNNGREAFARVMEQIKKEINDSMNSSNMSQATRKEANRKDLEKRFPKNNKRNSSKASTKTPFDNHGTSENLINYEESDANRIWRIEQEKMMEINRQFNKDIERMHAENRKLMAEAQSTNR